MQKQTLLDNSVSIKNPFCLTTLTCKNLNVCDMNKDFLSEF